MKIRVLFVGMRWDYKDPRRGDSFEFVNFYQSLTAMENVAARLFPFDEIEARLGPREMNRRLIHEVDSGPYDLVFFFLFEEEFEPATVERLSDTTTTLNWFADDTWRFHSFSKRWAPRFTYAVTTDPSAPARYETAGIDNVLLSQWACNHHLFTPQDRPRDIDVSFIGQTHSHRRAIVERLRAAGLEVRTWGTGWPAGRLPQDRVNEIISRSKVNLNLDAAARPTSPLTMAAFLVRPHGRISLSPSALVNSSRALRAMGRPQLKGRVFEIPGCRSVLVSSATPGIERYFAVGEEIVTFRDQAELVEACRMLVHDEPGREDIAQAGYERVIRDHTYEKRFNELFGRIGF